MKRRSSIGPRAAPRRLALLALVLLPACDQRGGAPGVARGEPADAVAVVEGRAITATQVARQAAAAHVSSRRALDDLIDAELLVAEAERRGLARVGEVKDAAAVELVRRWLATGFEKEVTPAAVTDDDLRRAYARNAGELDRPEMRFVVHVLVPFGAVEPDATRKQALRQRAEQVAARARQVHSAEAMLALAPALSDADLPLRAEEIATGLRGFTVPQFADPVFALQREGDVSGVVETRFGFHVIFLKKIEPPRHVPLEQAAAELRAGLWPEVRKREFARLLDSLADQHKIELHPDLLEEGPGSGGAR